MYGYFDCSKKKLASNNGADRARLRQSGAAAARSQRHLQNLKLIEGIIMKKTYREIANELGCKPSIVAGRVFRMRQEHSPYIDLMPPAGHLSGEDMSERNSRKKSAKVNMQIPPKLRLPSDALRSITKPKNAPKTFLDLGPYECSWAVEPMDSAGRAQMLCCAADVMCPSKREGDRRASHCAYHYALSIADMPSVKDKKS